ncbi:GNAT family N-acetyltransferase [Flavobacterium selenitireducens]|uniref:GNAT family N-acetyltransferase n=1 Tax=Flavobacterium selenitireducens TaxID=2722704 RepID=UPI00168AA2FD|nr:GNAT family protein [Flavobacterium selenitireducens]MBD3582645.1 GNAT family N-acetyltransferase [Flavobacterium selenitireducens]
MADTNIPAYLTTTERLLIRNLAPADLDDFLIYRSNPDIVKFQSFDVMDRATAEAFIDNQKHSVFGTPGKWTQFAIVHTETARMIGDCAIKFDGFDDRVAEIGITISHLYQKTGFAREALDGIVALLFAIPNFHRIVELVDTQNGASIKMLEHCGFRREGHFVKSYDDNGVWTDEFQYAMLREDRILL